MKISYSYNKNKMSTGKRLAKRSIIGTRVCAPGGDKLWYCGVIQKVKTPPTVRDNNCITLTPDTKYTVRFDPGQTMSGLKEYLGSQLIGPGFENVVSVILCPGQRIFLTYNGRESAAEVLAHDIVKDEVSVRIPANGFEPPIEVKKRLEEVRLLESRRSARLADQDTDFAKLADMANDRRRASHSIDVPLALTQHGSRKRRPSYSQDGDLFLNSIRDDDQMDECNAALVLMSLSGSPHSPRQWMFSSSPGSSNASWTSGSEELSDEGAQTGSISPNRMRTTSLSTSDEGIVMDYSDETPRKRRVNNTIFQCTWKKCRVIHKSVEEIEDHVREAHLGSTKSHNDIDDDADLSDSVPDEAFYYQEIEVEGDPNTNNSPNPPSPPTLSHRDMARPPHEDPEYQRQLVGNIRYRQGLLTLSQTPVKPPLPVVAGPINIPTSPLAHHNYTWAQQSSMSPQKHVRLSPRPSTSYAPYPSPTYTSAISSAQNNVNLALGTMPLSMTGSGAMLNSGGHGSGMSGHHLSDALNLSHSAPAAHRSPLSPNRRPRGENKKCRKQYGMEKKDMWCTQCKWKKACSRFGD